MPQPLQPAAASWKPTATPPTGLPAAVFAVPLIVIEPAGVLSTTLAGAVGPDGDGDVPEPDALHATVSQTTTMAAATAAIVRRTPDRRAAAACRDTDTGTPCCSPWEKRRYFGS